MILENTKADLSVCSNRLKTLPGQFSNSVDRKSGLPEALRIGSWMSFFHQSKSITGNRMDGWRKIEPPVPRSAEELREIVAMPTFGGMNIEPFKYEPGRGTVVANRASRVLLAAYMSAYDTSIRDVADAFGLLYDAVRRVINAQIGSDCHELLAESLELLEEIEIERQKIFAEEARPRRPDGKPICGARTRSGQPCRAPGVGNGGRCRMHGGLSTGPRTEEGRRRTGDSARNRIIERMRQRKAQASDAE